MVAEAVVQFFGASCGFRLTLPRATEAAATPGPFRNSSLVRTALGMGARILEEYSDEP